MSGFTAVFFFAVSYCLPEVFGRSSATVVVGNVVDYRDIWLAPFAWAVLGIRRTRGSC